MKRIIFILSVSLIILSMWTCSVKKSQEDMIPKEGEIQVSFELVSNDIAESAKFLAKFILKNNSQTTLGSSGWTMYYNMVTRLPIAESVPDIVRLEQINGDFYRMAPTEKFSLDPGETLEVEFEGEAWMIKKSDAPSGVYFVFSDSKGNEISRVPVNDIKILPFTKPEQISRHRDDQTPIPTADWQFEQNKKLKLLDRSELKQIIPTPVQLVEKDGKIILDGNLMIHHQPGLKREASLLADQLGNLMGKKSMVMESQVCGPNIICLRTGQVKVNSVEKEAYILETDPDKGVIITGSDPAGVFYGTQSLIALFPVETFSSAKAGIEINSISISDAPAFGYRGMHFDVGRNFQTKETVLKFLDIMAYYKMNIFHFHITDDEGWRLEIEELPELTQIGAFRGHTLDDSEYLAPAYGSGAFPDPEVSYGSGYYSRSDFIEILKYAADRHIEVIPEVNMPGHARAAIKAMEYRYRKLMKEGKKEEAEKYRLIDPDDRSEYSSAQLYNDNIICVCKDAPYTFNETVVDDIIEIYGEAGLTLKTLHTGGDEVPLGSWERSPICNELLNKNPEIGNSRNLQSYFFGRVVQILKERELAIAGWEEVAMTFFEDGTWEANAEFTGKNVIPYVWNSIWGNQDLGYRLANGGYPVILCNVNNFYFDFGYNKDPEEPGGYWGGFNDTKKAFSFIPYDLYKSIKVNTMGHEFDPVKDFENLERLSTEGYKNIVGLQGQLWSETIKGPDMLEYYSLPKMLGLAERAWQGTPSWASIEEVSKRDAALDQAWNVFANTIAQREFPRLDHIFGGYNYRIAPPGAAVIDGKLEANISFPGFVIRYTTDGSEPDNNSSLYEGPFELSGSAKLKAFNAVGRGSRSVKVDMQ
jgi:hexosaminidase